MRRRGRAPPTAILPDPLTLMDALKSLATQECHESRVTYLKLLRFAFEHLRTDANAVQTATLESGEMRSLWRRATYAGASGDDWLWNWRLVCAIYTRRLRDHRAALGGAPSPRFKTLYHVLRTLHFVRTARQDECACLRVVAGEESDACDPSERDCASVALHIVACDAFTPDDAQHMLAGLSRLSETAFVPDIDVFHLLHTTTLFVCAALIDMRPLRGRRAGRPDDRFTRGDGSPNDAFLRESAHILADARLEYAHIRDMPRHELKDDAPFSTEELDMVERAFARSTEFAVRRAAAIEYMRSILLPGERQRYRFMTKMDEVPDENDPKQVLDVTRTTPGNTRELRNIIERAFPLDMDKIANAQRREALRYATHCPSDIVNVRYWKILCRHAFAAVVFEDAGRAPPSPRRVFGDYAWIEDERVVFSHNPWQLLFYIYRRHMHAY